ncbi:dienelactone hydrolase family protein [Sphingomonas aracearum]|uniref:Dienelactone hydrolase family protein n=1 Tax=Sphingomonas aracearum TaxID=2283317 RepID=A0A369VWZ2_9SPHN|nr:dienelactone hydrolase family protein [Sphingomonas aracearum]RDE06904.1 dienelactone hydrolase family protein [Sphingomonas aracearum]
MCDELTAEDNRHLSRRAFGIGMSAASLALLLPSPAEAVAVSGRAVRIRTPDGTADAFFVAPATGRHPAVLMWPDIMGLRPAFQQMARRLAESGYAVLVVNQFYRSTRAPFLKAGESFDQPEVRAKIGPWREALTPEAITRDANAFVAFLDAQKEVDPKRPMGSAGYCMGGPFVLRTAAARADPLRAGASFHGAQLVTDAPDSPHRLAAKVKGGYLFAIAANDDGRAPGDKTALREAFAAAEVPAEIEVYAGAMHGWCPPDSKAYNQAQAERAWGRMLDLFRQQLA